LTEIGGALAMDLLERKWHNGAKNLKQEKKMKPSARLGGEAMNETARTGMDLSQKS